MNLKKITAAVAVIGLMASAVHAVDQSISAESTFRQALTLTKNFDIDFTPGSTYIDFAGTPGVADFVQLATNGTVSFAGTAFSGNTAGQAADVSIVGATSSAVSISCTTGAIISDGTNTLNLNQVQLSVNTGDAFGAADYTCAGLGTTPHSYTLAGSDKVLLGARIVGNSGTIASGSYNTASAGGAAATVRVLYQ